MVSAGASSGPGSQPLLLGNVSSPAPIRRVSRAVQPSRAESPMAVTLAGIYAFVSLVFSEVNAAAGSFLSRAAKIETSDTCISSDVTPDHRLFAIASDVNKVSRNVMLCRELVAEFNKSGAGDESVHLKFLVKLLPSISNVDNITISKESVN